jgi:Uma2 family endonuclease
MQNMREEIDVEGLPPETEIIATDVSEEDYMEHYAAHFCEWIDGKVIRLTPATLFHNNLTKYVTGLLDAYLELRPIGKTIVQPFVYNMPALKRKREPDLMLLLNDNAGELTETSYVGAADIVIEVVSKESSKRDRGDKFDEYEASGVREYWLIDSRRKDAAFYRLNAEAQFERVDINKQGEYETPLLPGLRVHIATLWETMLPGPRMIVQSVEAMLAENEGKP